ncbi:uncharacterized protein F5891DRAFT_1178319 [Suillus fuscotomentosus]|uniref:DUF6532 domain-containing protein n=1 Tax=Suillus fuscotomentosus TaxID=1912939 RepID=A0AAD4DNB6_9AGAM|nr:uncharacterized protein F5891DRAFT_1178319 [Suillus fuscotomentosus]KAG1885857.1 hypothetical protein F5891DRAFT_1178319 [Suillus fuscotomentosus]
MPPSPHLSSTPSDIAAHKRNAQRKAQVASQDSTGKKTGNTEEIWNETTTNTRKRAPTVTALQSVPAAKLARKNETTTNTRKRAPTVTALQSVPAAKLARKTPAEKLDNADQVNGHGQSQGRDKKNSKLPKSVAVSIEDNDSVSEYGESDHDTDKSDNNAEVPEDDDEDLVPSQKELIKEIPYMMPPRAARSASALSQTSKTLSNSVRMTSSGVSDESESELQFADKDTESASDRSDSQRSKASYDYREPSSLTNSKPQPSKKKKKKRSKVAEARQEIERPKFAESRQLTDEALPASADKELSEHSFTWPIFTDLVYSADSSINLKAQNTRIQQVLKTAVFELKKASIFDNAFPNITQKRKMALDAVYNAAGKHKEYAIAKRIKHDFDYAVALAGVPEGRLSSFRTNLKKLAHQIVVSRFGLKKGCGDEVDDLIKGHKYIFPTDAKGKVLGDQPFCDESMVDSIRLSFFDGENSIGVQSCDDFVSVLDGNNEPELPVAMVCLIATLIYSILKDWSSGNPPSGAQVKSFNSSFHISVYNAHQATLTRIFNGSRKKYHVLMARLYKAVSAVESSEPAGSLDAACDYLDLDAMGED